MRVCSKCGESIGVEVKVCPFCGFEHSDKDILEAKRDVERLKHAIDKDVINKYEKRIVIRNIIFISWFILLLAIAIILFAGAAGLLGSVHYVLLTIVGSLYAIDIVVGIIVIYIITRCPYCGRNITFTRVIGGNKGASKYCPACGGRIRK